MDGASDSFRRFRSAVVLYICRLDPRVRAAWLLLIKGEEVVAFKGGDLPGLAVVRGTDYHKNGKWSHNTYRLDLAPGVRSIPGKDGWETGRFAEGLRAAVGTQGTIDT